MRWNWLERIGSSQLFFSYLKKFLLVKVLQKVLHCCNFFTNFQLLALFKAIYNGPDMNLLGHLNTYYDLGTLLPNQYSLNIRYEREKEMG